MFVEVALLIIVGTGNVAAQVALHYKLCKPRQLHMNLAEVLRAHLELPHAILPGPINYAKAAGELRTFMSVKQLPASCTLFTQVNLSCVLSGLLPSLVPLCDQVLVSAVVNISFCSLMRASWE